MRRATVTEPLAAFRGPLFLAHGMDDRLVPATGSDALLATRPGLTVSFRTQADQLLAYTADPDGFERTFGAFLDLLLKEKL